MGKLRMLWSRVKGQAVQVREDEAFEEEMHEHIALLEKRYQAQGMSARESAQAARRQFGNVAALKEKQRAQRGILSPVEWARALCRCGWRSWRAHCVPPGNRSEHDGIQYCGRCPLAPSAIRASGTAG